MEWKVAPSFQHGTIEKVDEKNHKALVVCRCGKCGGTGAYIIPGIFSGVCFSCNGQGATSQWVKAYTETEYKRYIATQEKARERKAKAKAEKLQELDRNSDANKAALLQKFGFDAENPMIYLVAGGNTYAIKDELKERGGRYNAALNWYFTKETEVPEGYELVAIPFDDVYNWFPRMKKVEIKENAKEVAEAARQQVTPRSNSEYIGEIKERLRDLQVKLTGAREFSGAYDSVMFTFEQGENILTWFTASPPENYVVGNEYLLTGTVKDHKLYNGVKQTYLNRCVLKEI